MGKIILPFEKQKVLGQIDGLAIIDKFGETLLIATGDPATQVWDRDHNLTYLTSPTEFYISSSNNADNQKINCVVMTGAKKYVPVQITLQGNTPLALSVNGTSPDPDFCPGCGFLRGVRMKPDNGSSTAGDVYMASTNVGTVAGVPTDAAIQMWYSLLKQQTQMTHFTIPAGYYGLMTELFIGIINNGNVSPTNADIVLHRKHMDGPGFRNKWSLPLGSEGGPIVIRSAGKFIKPEYDMHFEVLSVGRNDTKITISYTVELYRADKINAPIVLD